MRATTLCSSILFFSSVCFGAHSVASVTSAGALGLSGTRIEAGTVPSWPLVLGDEITTFDSAAVIVFKDNSRVLLGSNSMAKIGVENGKMVLNMVTGGAVGLRPNPELLVVQHGKRVALVQEKFSDQKLGFDLTESNNTQYSKLPGAPSKPPSLSESKP
jgi:hypothetical protein